MTIFSLPKKSQIIKIEINSTKFEDISLRKSLHLLLKSNQLLFLTGIEKPKIKIKITYLIMSKPRLNFETVIKKSLLVKVILIKKKEL